MSTTNVLRVVVNSLFHGGEPYPVAILVDTVTAAEVEAEISHHLVYYGPYDGGALQPYAYLMFKGLMVLPVDSPDRVVVPLYT